MKIKAVIEHTEMEEYILEQLMNNNHIPTDNEITTITEIVEDYLMLKLYREGY